MTDLFGYFGDVHFFLDCELVVAGLGDSKTIINEAGGGFLGFAQGGALIGRGFFRVGQVFDGWGMAAV